MRRPVGLDINGWHDFGCRDWSAEDPDAPAADPISLDGGIESVIVQDGALIEGGPQAILSPIGRGLGWSDIGSPEKRRVLADHWTELLSGKLNPTFDPDMRAAAGALSKLADNRVICMPDHSGMGEAQQKRLLTALTGRREPRTILLWRPVALVLGLLESGGLPDADDGMRITCLIHGPCGLERQSLVLRRLPERPDIFAPERAGPGDICCPTLGLKHLKSLAAGAVNLANPTWDPSRTDKPRMASELLFQENLNDEEIVRRNNGNWIKLLTPQDFSSANLATEIETASVGADRTIVLSPLAARHHKILNEGLPASASRRASVMFASPDTAARGALYAARRIERDIPHYLDRLDQVSMIVMRREGPAFEDLVSVNATVPGNREYVSPPITSMTWTAGLQEVQFYIRKGSREIRCVTTSAVSAPDRNERLEIRLRQMPAQGWATLTFTSTEWEELRRSPLRLDWSALEVDPRSEQDIIAALQRQRPAVPQRVYYAADLGLWNGKHKSPGLAELLKRFASGDSHVLSELATAAYSSYGRSVNHPLGPFGPVYPVSTDGELPDELDSATRMLFFDVVELVSNDLLRTVGGPHGILQNNNALRFLTWIFAACPPAVQLVVIAAFKALGAGREHPLLAPRGAKRVIIHGVGRVVTDKSLIQDLLPLLCARLPNTDFLAPLSSILSRPVVTPDALFGWEAEKIAIILVEVLRNQFRANLFGHDFKYTLMVLAGLLRVRELDPWAFTTSGPGPAVDLATELRKAAERLEAGSANVRGRLQKLFITRSLIEFLETNNGRPDILAVIDAMEE